MRINRLLVASALGLGLTLAFVLALSVVEGRLPVARAASFTVDVTNDENDGSCSDGDCSLRDAIIEANGNGEADSITLGAGTHVLTLIGTDDNTSATGDLDVTGPLTITGLGPGQTIIDASGVISDRVLDIRSGASTVVISGVTIMNGNITGLGGGIYNQDAGLTLINAIVSSNVATGTWPNGVGGGVYVYQGSVTLENGQIVSNSAVEYGGGVFVYHGTAAFIQNGDSIIAHNIVTGSHSSGGGGVYVWYASATLNDGQIFANTAGSRGGGVYVGEGSAMLNGGQIVSNTAREGGGVFIGTGRATLSGGQILSNSASSNGGGVYVAWSGATFTQTGGSIIACNASTSGGGGVYIYQGSATLSGGQILSNTTAYGGGVYVVDSAAIFTQTGSSIIAYNVSDWGGGVGVASGSAVLSGARVVSNTANDLGGGVYVYQGRATLSGAQVISNTASDEGGGIYNNNGTLTLVNTTVSCNAAGDQGGGLYSHNGTSVLSYTTVASNTASWYGGIRRGYGGTVLFKDTLVAHNDPANCGGTLVSNGHNLDSDDTCGFTATGDITGTDPLLGPLAEESGAWVHPLLTGSPAINAGSCIAGITTDQRGVARPQAGICDIGAYEFIWRKVYLPLTLKN